MDKWGRIKIIAKPIDLTPLKSVLKGIKTDMANISNVDKIERVHPKIDEIEHVLINNYELELNQIKKFELRSDFVKKGQIKIGVQVLDLSKNIREFERKFLNVGVGIAKPPKIKKRDTRYKKAFSDLHHVKIKRKHWKGKPTYFETDFNAKKSIGYVKRSLTKEFKSNLLELFQSHKKFLERLRKSKTHIQMGQISNAELIETLELVAELHLSQSYIKLAEHLLNAEMSRNQIDAWDIYIMSDAPQRIYELYFENNFNCFFELPLRVRDFIRDNWDMYDERKQTAKLKMQNRYWTDKDSLREFLEKNGAIDKNDYSNTWKRS